jgi:hypothetical protein
LLMALPASCSEWWSPWDDDELEVDERGRRYLEFGLFRVHRLREGMAYQHLIRVYPSDRWEPKRDDYDPDLLPMIDNIGRVELHMPWGALLLESPIPEVVEVQLTAAPGLIDATPRTTPTS